MSNVVALAFEGKPVRVTDRDGDKWFVLSDVCDVLELSNASKAAERLDDDEKSTLTIGYSGGPERLIVSQPGLFKLIQTSRVPKAKEFDRWVRHEVLMEIERTGSYRGSYDGAVTFQQITALVAPMQADISGLKCDVALINGKLTEVCGAVGLLVDRKRHEFSDSKVLRPVSAFVLAEAKGRCLNCKAVVIVGDDGERLPTFAGDHWSGPQSNAIGNCFPVCQDCNLRLKDPGTRARAAARFQIFQEDLKAWLPAYWAQQKAKASVAWNSYVPVSQRGQG